MLGLVIKLLVWALSGLAGLYWMGYIDEDYNAPIWLILIAIIGGLAFFVLCVGIYILELNLLGREINLKFWKDKDEA